MSEDLSARLDALERLNDARFAYLASGFILFHDQMKELQRDLLALIGVLLRDRVVTEADMNATRDLLDIKFAVDEVTEPEQQALHVFRDRLDQELKRLADEAPA